VIEAKGWNSMARRKSREKRKAAFLEAAGKMFDELEAWYDEHEAATFGEIEQEARQQRRELMGEGLEHLINGRDTGFEAEGQACPGCGEAMAFKDYHDWTVKGLEGDTRLERAYYVCPACGETIFPPRPEAALESRPLE
jgi:hypothetical protein